MNVYMLHVDSRGKSLQRVVMQAAHGCQQFQIFADSLGEIPRKIMIVDGERYEVCEQAECFQILRLVGTLRGTTSERYEPNQFAPDAERCQTLKHFRRYIAVLT